jgi:Rab GDP dissociation inhibitor
VQVDEWPRLFRESELTNLSESASLNLTQLYKKFRNAEAPKDFGRDRDWNVDLVPKFLMANGELTSILAHMDITRYVDFKSVDGSFVYRDGCIAKVPSSEIEALRSSLMGFFEKRRMKKFLEFVGAFKDDDPSTQQGIDLDRNTMTEIYLKFGLEPGTRDFIGHAMALWPTDEYLKDPARETFNRLRLYASSVQRFGNSPYIYPMYGLGDLPQGFARLSAIYGGTYMLDTAVDEIVYGDDGKVVGVRSGDQTAKTKVVIGDPTYFPNKVRKTGDRVIRAICILNHPIPNTGDLDSLQIIIPQNQVRRKHDIYVAVVSHAHQVCAKDHWLAIVSTIIETDNPHIELEPAFKLLGPRVDTLMGIAELYEPLEDGTKDDVYISRSYDASSHFESTTDDVKDIYFRMTGKPLVVQKRAREDQEEV